MRDSFFRHLDAVEVAQFRDWARKNWVPGMAINPVWHPVVRAEIDAMIKENMEHGIRR